MWYCLVSSVSEVPPPIFVGRLPEILTFLGAAMLLVSGSPRQALVNARAAGRRGWSAAAALCFSAAAAVRIRADLAHAALARLIGPLTPLKLARIGATVFVLYVGFQLAEVELLAGTGTQGPWVKAINALCQAFTGTLGTGLSLIAIIIGGLMFAFGEGGSKSQIAGLIFGAGLTLQAPAFLAWLKIGSATC